MMGEGGTLGGLPKRALAHNNSMISSAIRKKTYMSKFFKDGKNCKSLFC